VNEQQEHEARQAYDDNQDMLAQDYLLREEWQASLSLDRVRERMTFKTGEKVFDADGNELIQVEELFADMRKEHEQVVTFFTDAIYSKTNNYPAALRLACSLLVSIKGPKFIEQALELLEKDGQAA
jgi:hypothetical protein